MWVKIFLKSLSIFMMTIQLFIVLITWLPRFFNCYRLYLSSLSFVTACNRLTYHHTLCSLVSCSPSIHRLLHWCSFIYNPWSATFVCLLPRPNISAATLCVPRPSLPAAIFSYGLNLVKRPSFTASNI